jgi:mannose-6-phosphate isomerase-like protein (cupin superfamily)
MRIQGGRAVLEGLRAGNYLFRFEKAGYVTFEREVTARGTKPIDVKVRLTPLSAPPPQVMDAKFVVLDMPAFIEKNHVGRESGRTTPLGCATGGAGTLLQIKESVAHAHDDADEFIYVIAGKGTLKLADREESLGPAVFLMIPRRMAHTLTASSKKPLVIMSVRAGETCANIAARPALALARR